MKYEYSVRSWSFVRPTSGVMALPEPVVVWQAPVMPGVAGVAADCVETSVTASPALIRLETALYHRQR